jgi:hypothetical protein
MHMYARTHMHMHACKQACMDNCSYADRVRAREVGHR